MVWLSVPCMDNQMRVKGENCTEVAFSNAVLTASLTQDFPRICNATLLFEIVSHFLAVVQRVLSLQNNSIHGGLFVWLTSTGSLLSSKNH